MFLMCGNCNREFEVFPEVKKHKVLVGTKWEREQFYCRKCEAITSGKAVCEVHVPDITGICKICGEEVVTEVDENGDPIQGDED